MTLEADYGEICRYLGYRRDTPPDSGMEQTIRACARRLEEAATPRWVSREFPLAHLPGGALELGELRVESGSLSRNLKGCQRVILFAATLGVEADRLIARASAVRMSEAVILQAAAAALIEACCDSAWEALRREAAGEGWHLRPRFSPGYGDFSIAHQRDIADLLQTPARIGLTVTGQMLLAPMKSVTAVIGMSRQAAPCHRQGCEACDKTDCAFRR